MIDTDVYIRRLEESNPLREPVLRAAIQALRLPVGSRGLDMGCGIGLQAQLLAEAVGPGGHVTGLDVLPELLRYADKIAANAGLADRLSWQQGDMSRLPFADETFDWVWSADCAGYPAGDLLPVLKEMTRVVKPGGSIVILAWSSQQALPGYPMLEARLNALGSGFAAFFRDKQPSTHFLRAPGWFREAGLVDVTAHTYVGDVQAPLSAGVRRAMILLFEMLWGERQPQLAQEDWLEYQRLCRPESPDCILNLPDYYAFFTYTMFQGRVSQRKQRG